MENAELDRISRTLSRAVLPEEVFGELSGTRSEMLDAARGVFRQLAKAVHPDVYRETADFAIAGSAFKKLVQCWEQAQARILNGTYGMVDAAETFEPFSICTKKYVYHVERLLTHGELSALYLASVLHAGQKMRELLKVSLRPEDNDLLANEARILEHLRTGDGYVKLRHFVSQLVDAFSYHEQATGIVRQVNVLAYIKGLYSLKQVREVYTRGVEPGHMAWIWRRLLVALGFAHANGVIHGAVLPTHILLHPAQHGVVLIDWSYAVLDPVESGECISALSSAYREWYPAEVFAREVPTPGLDIALAARCMIELLGGDPLQLTMPASVPWQLQSYLKGCTLARPCLRPLDAYGLLEEFDELIERLWGPRKFREFTMPRR